MHTFFTPLQRALTTAPDQIAVVCGEDRLSYTQLAHRVARLAGGLKSQDLRKGDRVAVLAANCHRYLESYLAVPAAGLVLVPLNTRHAEPELRYTLADSSTRVLITDRDPTGLTDVVEQVIRLPEDYEAILDKAQPAELGIDLDESTLAGLFYTGGTTGAAKGVMLSHGNLTANAWHVLVSARLAGWDRWLVMAPMFHAAGTVATLAMTWLGAAQVMLPTFDPARALDLIATERVTATLGVPTMISALADEQLARPRDVSTLRLLSHGGSPIASEILRRAHQAFPDAELVHYYGATETAPIVTALPREQLLLQRPQVTSCGQPVIGVQVRIVNDAGAQLPAGRVGEVAICGRNVMSGYWNKPTETLEVLRDGWYLSGDLGYLDDDSYLYLVDRKKDMIITGGENVYSTEVEDALYSHPAVLEAAVFGVPDPTWGEAVYAVVVPRTAVTAEDITEHCRSRIAGYKLPKAIEIRAEPLPKSGAGKVLKRELRQPHWAGIEQGASG